MTDWKRDYPALIVPVSHVAAVPRRVRAFIGATPIVDTISARYVWEKANYPAFYLPLNDFAEGVLAPDGDPHPSRLGTVQSHSIVVGDDHRPKAARVFIESPIDGIEGTVRDRLGCRRCLV